MYKLIFFWVKFHSRLNLPLFGLFMFKNQWIWILNILIKKVGQEIHSSLKPRSDDSVSWIFLRMLIIGGRFCCNIVQEVMNLKDRHKRFCKTLNLNELNHISYNQMVDLISLSLSIILLVIFVIYGLIVLTLCLLVYWVLSAVVYT